MKKMVKYIFVSIILSIITISVFWSNNYNNTFVLDGVLYAVTLDGTDINEIPEKGAYRVDVSCINAIPSWDYNNWKLILDDIKGNISCSLSFTTSEIIPIDDYIVSLEGNGQVTNENGYRYVGKPVDNYIWFNEELWQVIGVFDTILADGTTTERLTKIIKADSIGGLAWDSGDENNWNESDLKNLLNTSYLNSEYGTTSGYCYGYTGIINNCNYISTGIKDAYNNLIEDVTWNLGGLESSGTPEAVYNAERGTTVYSGRPTSGTGKIGLMYLSDYGYSANPSTCARTTNIDSYRNQNCAGSSWMYQEGYEWTIVPNSSNASSVWNLENTYANVNNAYAANGFAGRPVLYLKSNVEYLDGSGTQDDPMQIGVQ